MADSMQEEDAVGQATGVAGPPPPPQQGVPLAGGFDRHNIISIERPVAGALAGGK